jgi:glycosyltransferase involved in cell wall biosynthesis
MQRVVLAYKNFAAHKNISHIGLGVSAINTLKVLRHAGIDAEVWPIVSGAELEESLRRTPATHVVISAPWIPSPELQALITAHYSTCFAVNCHSNVGFLQADANGVRRVREAMEIEAGSHNFHLAGNSIKFCKWIHSAYFHPCIYLPNLYYLDGAFVPCPPLYRGGALRIGAFGATRPLKNLMSAAGAALEISRNLKADLELWLSAGRVEGGGDTILRAAQAMLEGVPNVRLVQNGWQSWPKFRQSVAHMHLLLQPSYTESFNMVTADGIAEGVPSVVSRAIDWAPDHWKAVADDVLDIARVGRYLLHDPRAARDGREALETHNETGLAAWRAFLKL